VNHSSSRELKVGRWARNTACGLLSVASALAFSGIASAREADGPDQDVVTFELAPVGQFLDCLRANSREEPRMRGTLIHGKQNDTLILDMDGIKPNLTLSVFSNERSFFAADGNRDPNFHGFGLSWYHSDISTNKRSDDGHVRIQSVFSDETFGLDKDANVNLNPTNAYHIGIWFDDPQDAVACGFVPDPAKPQPFNGEHNSGPLAFETVPDANGIGPLCPHSNPGVNGNPGTCGAAPPAPFLAP
jgi:hypothetical protein